MKVTQPLLSLDWNLLFSAVTVIVLFFILKHFFFEKVHNFMVNRENEIRDSISHAETVNAQAEEKLAAYRSKIDGAEEERRQILKAARDEAKIQAKEIIDEAGGKARDMVEHAQKEIRREQYNARKELQEEVGGMAMLAAEQILERELSDKDQQDILGRIIEEAEEKPWN